jgi:tRNA pseudouridine55 synthase
MNGLLIIDKPPGVSSFDMVRRARRWCATRKVGHAGTLDPLATGVLPVAVGSATRLVEYLMEGDKVYRAELRLGQSTTTQDSEGEVLAERDWHGVGRDDFASALHSFIGEIEQLPPMYSALKRDGKPLYQLAREGVEVERQPRPIRIDSINVESFEPPLATITVGCGKGTYIRTLCHDIGELLGCGAHMTALRRVACGRFTLADSSSPEVLEALVSAGRALPLLSPAQALADWPALTIEGADLQRLNDGVAPSVTACQASTLEAGERLCFLDGERLAAIARFAPGGVGKRPGDFELLKVFPPTRGS